jgi:hypothetical protein
MVFADQDVERSKLWATVEHDLRKATRALATALYSEERVVLLPLVIRR